MSSLGKIDLLETLSSSTSSVLAFLRLSLLSPPKSKIIRRQARGRMLPSS
jgi:hypothetical protein